MLVAKIISCILAFLALMGARILYNWEDKSTMASNIVAGIAGILSITFCTLLILNWNLFTIPKIMLFASICLYIVFKIAMEDCDHFIVGITFTIIAFIVTGIMYICNIERCEVPDVSSTRTTVICAKDNSSTIGNISGGVMYIKGSVTEESVYKYYYQLEDGGIKQGTVPADVTTIYFVKSGEEAYLENIVTTSYWLNTNNKPATRLFESSKTTYKLYVPEGAIVSNINFDAE